MKINFDELDVALGDVLMPTYLNNGFGRFNKTCVFERDDADALRTAIIGPHAQYCDFASYTPMFYVNNHQIASVVKEIFGQLDGPISINLISQNHMAKFSGSAEYDNWKEYRMSSENDVARIADHHLTFMDKIGFRLLNDMDLHKLSQWINLDVLSLNVEVLAADDRNRLIRRKGLSTVIFGIIAAWFDKDPRFVQLASTYRDIFYLPHLYEKIDLVLNELPVRYPQ
jgi:hypothetical protein